MKNLRFILEDFLDLQRISRLPELTHRGGVDGRVEHVNHFSQKTLKKISGTSKILQTVAVQQRLRQEEMRN